MIAPTSGSARAARRASWSPKGRWVKPGRSGPKPLVIFSDPAAAMPAEERPWNEPVKARMRVRSAPRSYQYLRAILIANSQASVPELVKKQVSAKVCSTSASASACWAGIW